MAMELIPVINISLIDKIALIEKIDALLPQTQCTKCGYDGCKPYATAIANGDAINKCPPGGAAGIAKLAALLGQPEIPLDTTHGEEPQQLLVAYIRETECIGCTKCIQACPVDAILGAAKLMHTVIADICTGCDLCVAPCPVDCIDMIPAAHQHPSPQEIADKANGSRQRFNRRNQRLEKIAAEKFARKQTRPGKTAVNAALNAAQEKAAAQSTEDIRAKLERTLASAQERFERADGKVREAEKKKSDQLAQLQARREDMRFKLEETRKKIAELDSDKPATTSTVNAALEKMQALRSQKSDLERLTNGLAVLEGKLLQARQQLPQATGDEAIFIQEDIE
ncbi:MAG TPA: electron transport complex subunit RsxB, partial [Pseudomonadales bacterium]|nr:electron transport complex subunit RsxB [Pseudomonadales bacterium]